MTSLAHVIGSRAAILVLAALVLAGCSSSAPEEGETSRTGNPGAETAPDEPVSAELTVVDGRLRRTAWAIGNQVRGLLGARRPEKLAGPVHAPLTGTLSPAAVPSPANDDLIAYNSFLRKRPVLRLHDLARNKDSVLDVGTFSLAWGRDRGLAYFKGLKPRVGNPARYLGHVVVRAQPKSKPVRWTTAPGRYAVSAWAENRLLVHQLRQGWPDLVVFDGPRRKHVLADDAALVALSPDGSRAFVTKRPNPSPVVSVVELPSGREVASFRFSDEVDPSRGQPITFVADSGAWTGDTVIAAIPYGVAFFRVTEDEIVLEELLGVDPDVFPLGLSEPKTDETGRYFVAGAELMPRPRQAIPRVALMECDRVKRHCVLDRSAPSFQPPRPVYNPSRP